MKQTAPDRETLIDFTINGIKNVEEELRRECVVAMLTCIALETGTDLCDSMRLLHGAMVEIDKLFDCECDRGGSVCYEGMAN